MIRNFIEKLEIEYKENISLENYNTYRLKVICDYMVFPKNYEQLIEILKFLKKNNIKYMILGNGSNIILECERFKGVIIKLKYFNKLEIKDSTIIAEAGCSLLNLSLEAINNSLSGLEFANAIPGDVGASVVMNAGAYNEDMSMVVKEVLVIDDKLQLKKMTNEELDFSYRDSFLKENSDYVVVSATFQLKPGNKEEMLDIIKRRIKIRKEMQPLEYPSAGSVFRNPDGTFAGKLIEEANLKKMSVGGAEISEKHANFIINKGNATGKDILKLIDRVKKEVKNKYNIELTLEQIVIK